MKLIVGLGNPGKNYEKTRHNVGFMVLDHYLNGEKYEKKFNGEYIEKNINGEKVIFLKPLSYMNLSGDVVVKFKNYYKIELKDILIIHDDLDLNLGVAKIKYSSSSGGNNGIKSIIDRLNSKDFGQYKIGIANYNFLDAKDYVLGKFYKSEEEILNKKIDESVEVINYFISNGIEKTMNYYNGLIK